MKAPSLVFELKVARLRANLSRHEMADLIGVSYTTIANWECGRYAPDLSSLLMVMEVCPDRAGRLLRAARSELLAPDFRERLTAFHAAREAALAGAGAAPRTVPL